MKAVAPFDSPDVRGKVGQDVYFVRAGRQFVKPYQLVNPAPTAAQLARRADLADLVARWKVLTAAERRTWADAARPPSTGFNLFVSSNMSRLTCSLTRLDAFGTVANPYRISLFVINFLDPDYTPYVEVSPAIYTEDVFVDFWAHGPLSPTRKPDFKHAVHVATLNVGGNYMPAGIDPLQCYGFWVRPLFLDSAEIGPWAYLYYSP